MRTLIQAKIDAAKSKADEAETALNAANADVASANAAMATAHDVFGDWMDYEPQAIKDKADALIAEAGKYA